MTEESPQKKQRTLSETKTQEIFRIIVSAPCSFKNMCDVIGSVFETINFNICKNASFTGFKVESMDAKQVAFVDLRYACPVTIKNGETEIVRCIKLKTFTQLLKHVPNTSVLHLVQYEGDKGEDNTICIETFDERMSKKVFYCKTLQILDEEEISIDKMSMDNVLEFGLGEFKSFMKLAKDMKAPEVSFSILNEKTKQQEKSKQLIVTEFDGDDAGGKIYHLKTSSKSAAPLGESAVNLKDWNNFYHGLFDTMMINDFLKNMDRESKIIICLNSECMVCEYTLGVQGSWIRFFLAPKEEENI